MQALQLKVRGTHPFFGFQMTRHDTNVKVSRVKVREINCHPPPKKTLLWRTQEHNMISDTKKKGRQ